MALRMDPFKLMGQWTERQLRIMLAWLEMKEHPDYLHYYLQRVACEVSRVLSDKPNNIQPKDFALKFESARPKLTLEEAAANSKSRWASRLGSAVNQVKES